MTHPYRSLPESSFWRKSVAKKEMSEVEPVCDFGLTITKECKVATAGSCFAQHIARHLSNSGFNYLVSEPGNPLLSETLRKEQNYGLFSARYGNIYTARQLLQLFKRAFGLLEPIDSYWEHEDGSFRDPFRPTTQIGGYPSIDELVEDRNLHLHKVREMFSKVDVFVFTLGLTECWRRKEDGVVFPICPGVEGGSFDSDIYEFYNQNVSDIIADLKEFISLVRLRNPSVKILFTVSPVPLMATAEPDQHVLTATTYSKSVLRVAAAEVVNQSTDAFYFPSYEIITGNFNRGSYYAEDLRGVVEDGVNHVMRVFFKNVTDKNLVETPENIPSKFKEQSKPTIKSIVDVECDEELLDRYN